MKRLLLLAAFWCCLPLAKAEGDSNRVRKAIAWSGLGGTATGVQAALYKTWYSAYPSEKFHWINDNHEWLQMDKFGHAWASAFLTSNTAQVFEWAGYNRRKSAIFGASLALLFQYSIEYFDGHSAGWGASSGDLIANTSGILFGGVQRYLWGKCRLPFRFTFHHSPYASVRPNILGSNFQERILKDYNGQTYWLDFNWNRLGFKGPKIFSVLGFSLGYGAEGMVGGDDNIWTDKNGNTVNRTDIRRYRQFYLSPSLSFAAFKSRYTAVNALIWLTDHIRLPMPALELRSSKNMAFHWLYW